MQLEKKTDVEVKRGTYCTGLVIDLEVVLELLGRSPLEFSLVIDQSLGHLGSVVRNTRFL
jgi:hypothetical protein